MTLRLQSGEWRAQLRPEIGGCLSSLTLDGVEILRTMPEGSRQPLESACFPLVPYCNRIRDGRVVWAGREVQMPANFPPEPHSLHGLGWQQPWKITREAGFKCSLAHSHDGSGGWPWAYEAEQRVRLGLQGCAITLDVTNRADTAMPCGLGLHPYLRRRPETQVAFAANAMLEVDEGLIPTGATTPAGEWSGGRSLPARTIDHCLADWNGTAQVSDDLGSVSLRARGARFLHLYAPADGSALCLEPVSHQPDGVNSAPDQMIVLPPGCTASLTMWISAE
ncbi:MAG: aldose 1-epimerase [Croceibacterium sp.]